MPNRKRSRPPDYFDRRQQVRLIALVFSLMLVCFLIVEAGKPQNWRWFFGGAQDGDRDVGETNQEETIDTKLATPIQRARRLPEGVFVSPADLRDDLAIPDAQTKSRLEIGSPLTESDYAAVKDDTVFRAAEAAAWYKLLAYLKESENEELRAASMGPVSCAQLHETPAAFRGRVVELSGVVRRAHYLAASKNDFGIEGYWRCWLFPPNSQNPIVVYALELPHGFPEGMKLREDVQFTGVFFKRWAYASKSGSRVAPLVVAGRGTWQATTAPTARRPPGVLQTALIVAACALLATALAWLAYRFAQWKRPDRLADGPVTVALQDVRDAPSVEEATERFLNQLPASDTDD